MLLKIISWGLYGVMILVGLFLLYMIRTIDKEMMDTLKLQLKYHLRRGLPIWIIASLSMLPTKEFYVVYMAFIYSFGSYGLGVVAQMIYDARDNDPPPKG